MAKLSGGRPDFREWVDRQTDPGWGLMPLTHITKGLVAADIFRDGAISTTKCDVFNEPLAYFFYGRPAYRLTGDDAVKVEAASPFCFVFEPDLIKKSRCIFAFDTGAFQKRLYKHVMLDEMHVEDFSLEIDHTRPNRIISAVFGSLSIYFRGDISKVAAAEDKTKPWDYHARAYMQLLASPGRNEPDDRICSIEAVFDKPVQLAQNLIAVVVPHTHWDGDNTAPWLKELSNDGVTIAPYIFVPGRHPEHYHALLETAVQDFYKGEGYL